MNRILSGIQPSGALHLGNFFGMMQPAIRLQDEGDAYYFIADYHALTTVHDPAALRSHVRDVALDFLACGLDPKRCCFFRQSDIPEVVELSWILSTVTPMGLLERATSYKDKVARGLEATHGLFAYPVLMAADILLYESDFVPVGKDQKQHLEMTRDIAGKFNDRFGETFKLPAPLIGEAAAVVPGTDGLKMSKSYGNTLEIFADEKSLKKKIMSLVTDSTPVESPKPTENSTLLALYRLVSPAETVSRMEAEHREGGVGYGEFKKRLFGAVWETFAPMRTRRAELESNPAYIEEVLRDGARRARVVAEQVLKRVRVACGLR